MFKSKLYYTYSDSLNDLGKLFIAEKTSCIIEPFTGFRNVSSGFSLSSRKDVRIEAISLFCAIRNTKFPTKDIIFSIDSVDKANDITSLLNIDVSKFNAQNQKEEDNQKQDETAIKSSKVHGSSHVGKLYNKVTNKITSLTSKITSLFYQDTTVIKDFWDRGIKLCFPKQDFKGPEGAKNFFLDRDVNHIKHYFLTSLCVCKDVEKEIKTWSESNDKLVYINLDLCKETDIARMLNFNVKLICDAQTTFSNLLVEEGSSVTLPTEKDSDTKPVGEIQPDDTDL